MSTTTDHVIEKRIVFVGVHDSQRHSIPSTEQLHEYPDGGFWAFARCRRAAYEPPEGGAMLRQPMCDECVSLEREEAAKAAS
jgi:hypothetical protein